MDKSAQPVVRKEPAGRIQMFAVPMKITPTKSTHKVTPKRITLTSIPLEPATFSSTNQATSLPVQQVTSPDPTNSKQATFMSIPGQLNVSSFPVTNAASQITPRRVSLMPAGNSQPGTNSNEIKPTAKVPPRRVELQSTPLQTSGPTINSSQPRRVTLTPVPVEKPKDIASLIQPAASLDKENKPVNQFPNNNNPQQPRRVTFTTLTSPGSEKTEVEGLQNSSRTSPSQGTQSVPRRPIPLEPKIIIWED